MTTANRRGNLHLWTHSVTTDGSNPAGKSQLQVWHGLLAGFSIALLLWALIIAAIVVLN